MKASKSQSAGERCEARGGTYFGDGSTCNDSDGDGIPDVMENNNCCDRGPCKTGTNPFLPDTDSDGADDGVEVKKGTDPCDDTSTP
jgi:hypothetical protein